MKDADVGLLAASTSLVWSDFSERLMIKSMRHLSKARERERQNIFRVEVYRLDCRGLAAATSVVSTFMLFLTISEPFLSLKAQKKREMVLFHCHFHSLSGVSLLWSAWKQHQDLSKTLRYNDQCLNRAVFGAIGVVKSIQNSYYWCVTLCSLLRRVGSEDLEKQKSLWLSTCHWKWIQHQMFQSNSYVFEKNTLCFYLKIVSISLDLHVTEY